MIKVSVKQKNLRVFHIAIEDKNSFLVYLQKNIIILKEFFLLIDGKVDKSIENILKNEGLCYKNISDCNIKFLSVKKELEIEDSKLEYIKDNTVKKPLEKEKLKVYDRPIRSGEEINEELPIVVFGRINSGARLLSSQSISIYGIIDGLVQCDGDYIILRGIGQFGNLIFNGEIIDKDILKKDILQKIVFNTSKIEVKEV